MTLYSKEIIECSKALKGQRSPAIVTHTHRLSNPICGDRVEWRLNVQSQQIVGAWVEVKGCALCKASAALLFNGLTEQTIDDASIRIQQYLADVDGILNGASTTGDASLFDALPMAPARKECVVLPWNGLVECLAKE